MNKRLPPGWVWTRIADVSGVQLGRQRSPKYHSGKQMRPYLRSANVTWSGVDLDDVKTMNFDDTDFEKYRLRPGDILLNEASGSSSEVGKPVVWNNEIAECCFQNTLIRLQPYGIKMKYLYWYCRFSALTGRFGNAGQGVNIRHLGKTGLAQFPIPIPPLKEQERIVDRVEKTLARLDGIETTLNSLLERADQGCSSILADTFHTNRPLPSGWSQVPMGEVCEIVSGGTPRTTVPAYWGGAISWLTPKDLSTHSRQYIEHGARSLTDEGYDACSARLMPEGTVVFTSRAPIGYVAILSQPACTNQGFKSFIPPRDLLPEYLYWYLRHSKSLIVNMGSGTTFKELSKRRAAAIPLLLTSMDGQVSTVEWIESVFSHLDVIKDSIKHGLRLAATLRKSVLTEAFAGRLVPQDPDDEPASILLERIGASRPAKPKRRRRARV